MTSALISDAYRDLNAEMHEDPAFGSGAHAHAPMVAELCRVNQLESVLDYGCGKGTLKPALAEIVPDVQVSEYDPAVSGKDQEPVPADLVVSLDVFEHIEPDALESVLTHIASKTGKAMLALISLQEARRILPDGRNAHLIVEDESWWDQTLAKHFQAVSVRVLETQKEDKLERHLLYIGRSLVGS